MHWFSRPPYLRWAAAAAILIVAAAIELRPDHTIPHPFTTIAVPAGTAVTAEVVEFQLVPAGLLSPVIEFGYAADDLASGEPITASAMTFGDPIPVDWWLVTVPMTPHVTPGTAARLVLGTPPRVLDVVVAAPGRSDGFDSRTFGAVAVPPEHAAVAASAAATGDVVVLLRP